MSFSVSPTRVHATLAPDDDVAIPIRLTASGGIAPYRWLIGAPPAVVTADAWCVGDVCGATVTAPKAPEAGTAEFEISPRSVAGGSQIPVLVIDSAGTSSICTISIERAAR